MRRRPLMLAFVALSGAALLAGIVHQASALLRAERDARLLAAVVAEESATLHDDASPAVRLAAAQALQRAGREEEAIAMYTLVGSAAGGDSTTRAAARYDLANLHLRRATALLSEGALDRVQTQVELAKELYRGALRLRPDHWDAKYNLETALYIRPDLPPGPGGGDEDALPARDVRSEMTGLPSGHP